MKNPTHILTLLGIPAEKFRLSTLLNMKREKNSNVFRNKNIVGMRQKQ